MKIIADAGSTKTNWAIINDDGTTEIVNSPGINPLTTDDHTIIDRLTLYLTPKLQCTPDSIIYYGAGCIPPHLGRMKLLIKQCTGCTNVEVRSDMLGAARSLCGHNRGIACILGTGSNSCFFDGHDIVDATPALGYILGDEGSGSALGRRLVGDLYKRRMPARLVEAFRYETYLTMTDVIESVYRRPEANKFLASLVRFINNHIDKECIEEMVTDEFCRFLTRNVANYPDVPVSFTGSIAMVFEPQLVKALHSLGMELGKIEADPLAGMIEYHTT
ncbi:MAG: ATPase [Bacteroides sp.]|nr:ATPase [Bacteroides sp.]MCM1412929.1 ATPase [Bacteroides sp.]MCM1471598.1 ATPase [Bacteroides sp.]